MLDELMTPLSSWSKYRKKIEEVSLPAIPYLYEDDENSKLIWHIVSSHYRFRGVYLTDITFIDDGNPDMLDGKINFPKHSLLVKVGVFSILLMKMLIVPCLIS